MISNESFVIVANNFIGIFTDNAFELVEQNSVIKFSS